MADQQKLLKIITESGLSPSVSILQSKREIQQIEIAMQDMKQHKNHTISGANKKQISRGVSIDWKQFQQTEKVRNQLILKDIENSQKVIFSYLIEEWKDKTPAKVIYKWIRRPKNINRNRSSTQPPLLEEEHIYRGGMENYRKHGSGVYIILRKLGDNTQRITKIKGEWNNDILQKGFMTDDSGKEQIISRNTLKLNIRSKKIITPFQNNSTIEQLRKQSEKMIPLKAEFKLSSSSIRDLLGKH